MNPLASVIHTSPEHSDNILLIHGMHSSKETWTEAMTTLSRTHNVYAIDLRGHGSSPLGSIERFSIATLVSDVVRFIDSHNLQQFSIIAHSMGARIAVPLAASLPGRIRHLIIEDMEMLPRAKPKPISASERRKLECFNPFQTSFKKLVRLLKLHDFSSQKIRSLQKKRQLFFTGDGYNAGINPHTIRLLQERVACSTFFGKMFLKLSPNLPILLLRASIDSSVSDRGQKKMQSSQPHTRCITVPTSRHSIHKSATEAFLDHVIKFMA